MQTNKKHVFLHGNLMFQKMNTVEIFLLPLEERSLAIKMALPNAVINLQPQKFQLPSTEKSSQ